MLSLTMTSFWLQRVSKTVRVHVPYMVTTEHLSAFSACACEVGDFGRMWIEGQ
jgi:hypothetical protein